MHDDVERIFADAETLLALPGSFLFHVRDRVRFVYIIDSGVVSLERVQPSGLTTCFQRAEVGDVLAEASVYASAYHCDARALNQVSFRRVRKADFQQHLSESPHLANIWAEHLARTVQRTRLSAEIRSFKTVRERLDAWLDEYGALPAKGQWQSLAYQLAVSPEALYRELSKRKKLSDH